MLKGIAASEGYGIGKIVVIKEQSVNFIPKTDCVPKVENARIKKAIESFCVSSKKTAESLSKNMGQSEAEIILGHITMVQDPYMLSEIEKLIESGFCAESAFSQVCDTFINMFSAIDDELVKQRAVDVKDIKNDILYILLGIEKQDISNLPKNSIIVTQELTPSMTASINQDNVVGIVTATGGKTSHAAILARTMAIPAVLSLENGVENIIDGSVAIVDGINGNVIISPNEDEVKSFEKLSQQYINDRNKLAFFKDKMTVTEDDKQVELVSNIGSLDDLDLAINSTAEGIGLFRTEFLFMERNNVPSSDEQFEVYKKVAIAMKNKPVIIRTLDIGGDKEIPYLGMKKEENPFLGFRAVRYCLKNEDIFRSQLIAILKASAYGDIRIMIPLVTGIEELLRVKKLIKDIKEQLDNEKVKYNAQIKLGVMIETPAAAIMADVLAKEADFFSIGTNDLIQYTMVVDRGNADVAYLYSPFNPAVLRLIKNIITCGKNENILVGMCGEAASDELLIPLFLSFGLDEFSVNPSSILKTRSIISKWTLKEANEVTKKVMSFNTAEDVIDYLESVKK